VPSDVDGLFGAPLEEFVARRDVIAKALRKQGRKEEADEVAGLRKPAVAAWVVNTLARDERGKIRALIRAAAGVKAGRKGADAAFRETVDGLTQSARAVLEAAGKRPTDAVLRDVATTLRAAAAADSELLAAGRLETVLEPSGFEAMAGATLRPRPARPAPKKVRQSACVSEAREAVDAAVAEARRLRRLAGESEREAARAARAATLAEEQLAKAERALADARRS